MRGIEYWPRIQKAMASKANRSDWVPDVSVSKTNYGTSLWTDEKQHFSTTFLIQQKIISIELQLN